MRRALLLGRARLSRWRAARAAAAAAHPLGNFSINHLTRSGLDATAVDVRYILDQAEIPTFQERGLAARDGARAQAGGGRARLDADGRRPRASRCAPRPGARISLPARPGRPAAHARRAAADARRVDARRARSSCATRRSPAASAGRRSSRGRARAPPCARASPRGDPTHGLRALPAGHCSRARSTSATRDVHRRARRRHADGAGAPGDCGATTTDRSGDGFAGVFDGRGGRPGRAAAPAAGRVRLGRAARALARARQGDGRGLPGRHARHGPRTRSRSARPSRSRTRSASSRSGS